ncbi:TonB-dependent receptor domain-containing protein [Sphingosinicella sp. LY1275]|uniref:TonB-dependent receptor domain-containing protein n=1 Tax=Sphingosinicella sp. LY1275 TaxID=3095379 RepID=UPI002ADEA772|nr:TonB-dependent receptor [Sphingosinicella sp. LY1275]MEA1013926.1 TonB-dependent receptor [Sphingosinicella sp. LY1275]
MRKLTWAATLLGGVSLMATAAAAQTEAPDADAAQEDAVNLSRTDAPGSANPNEEIVVVGSHIKGVDVSGALPVTILDENDIDSVAAENGDDLFRAIAQAGDVNFNETQDVGGSNDARGDVASINLRALGTGNTLVLLNGRRMVLHPGTQTENLVPVQSVNTNAIPVMGVRRVEVLLDGAAAIYGSDAVAGVVNTVLKKNLNSLAISAQVSLTEDSDQESYRVSFEGGNTFNDGKTNISVFGSYNKRDPLWAHERKNSRSRDLRPLLEGTPFEGMSAFDNRSLDTPWGEFQRLTLTYAPSTTTAYVNGEQLTTSGLFHVQPAINGGCVAPAGNGVCYDNSTLATLGSDANVKYNSNAERMISGGNERLNLFGFVNHEFESGVELFGEVGYYGSDFNSQREQETALSSQRLIIPVQAYWNPMGPVGSPNRIPGLTGVLTSGVPLELRDYRPVDAGPLKINVKNATTRFLGGLRGETAGFDWETAALYSRARTNDTMETISLTKFQEALSRTDWTGYNPFNGGDPLNPGSLDSTPNHQSIIDSFIVDTSRINTTSLTMADFKVSRNDLFNLPAGRVGMAAGVEFRHETFSDDRDDRFDGTIVFTALDGSSNGSDVMGASPTPDSSGSRDVYSGFAELAVPLVSPRMNVPGVHSLNMQLAGRVESYDGFGTVATPKIALSYHPIPWLQVRGAWSQGFRAPGLPQLFENGIERANGRTDWVRCEADLRAGRISNIANCGRSFTSVSQRSGSRDLKPERSENLTIGITAQPPLPDAFGRLTLTADFWQIKQKDLIGIFGDNNALTLDYLMRAEGSFNPNVVRADPTPDEIALFDGTGLAPVGRVMHVADHYMNLNPRTVQGVDVGAYYRLRETPIGTFSFRVNAAHLLKFYQEPSELHQRLLDGQAAGTISSQIRITGAEDLVRQNARPAWRGSASITWRLGQFGAGYFGSYVGSVVDTSAVLPDGSRFRVSDHSTHNLYLQYVVDTKGSLDGTRLRIGVRNIFNNLPPLADATLGYLGSLYNNNGRVIYASIRNRF